MHRSILHIRKKQPRRPSLREAVAQGKALQARGSNVAPPLSSKEISRVLIERLKGRK
jgi:hypothetical protein